MDIINKIMQKANDNYFELLSFMYGDGYSYRLPLDIDFLWENENPGEDDLYYDLPKEWRRAVRRSNRKINNASSLASFNEKYVKRFWKLKGKTK